MAKDNQANEKHTNRPKRTMIYAGSGMAVGAGLGLMFGLLLWNDVAWGLIIGVAAGLIVGAIVDAQAGS